MDLNERDTLLIFEEQSGPKDGNYDFFVKDNKLKIQLDYETKNLKASYFVGVDRIYSSNEGYFYAAVVHPKKNYDYLNLFSHVFNLIDKNEFDYLSDSYGIEFNESKLNISQKLEDYLSPLMIFHYVGVLENLIKRGLKKGYVYKEENLKSKIKGAIKVSSNIHTNIVKQRFDYTVCGFCDYTIDIIENRLLKLALIYSKKFLASNGSTYIKVKVNKLLSHFSSVSSDVKISEIKQLKINKIFNLYPEAIRLAKLIIKRFDYSIDNTEERNTPTYPYWIDMSRIYELYVLTKLRAVYGNEILFQVSDNKGSSIVDYLRIGRSNDDKWILDAKYKPAYDKGEYINDDIGQLCRYARNKDIFSHLHINKEIVNSDFTPICILIHPQDPNNSTVTVNLDSFDYLQKNKSFSELLKDNVFTEISPYINFYKLKIVLPVKNET